jgi:hypothetical protein
MKNINTLNNMKKILTCLTLIVSLVMFSCEDLSKVNIDPTKASPNSFDPNYFLSSSQWEYLNGTMGYNGPQLFQSGWMQILASTSTGGANYYSNMDKYVASGSTNDYLGRSWNGCYRSASLANQILLDTDGKSGYDNLRAIAKIMILLNIQYVTDMYGDCPYSTAFLASSGNSLPSYDSQESLYTKLLSELDAAVSSLDASKAAPSTDLIYNGDVAKWKKFGYSLMLRMAMRLVKANAATAKTYAEKAATGGVFASSSDDAFIVCDNAHGYQNDYARDLLTPSDFYQVRWSKTLIDYLSNSSDPRLGVIAEVPQDGLTANQTVGLAGDNTPSKQLGLPNGYDLDGKSKDITLSPGYPGGTGTGDEFTPIGKYSRPRTSVYGDRSGPVFILTYAQTELLLAEAAVRGYSVTGSATLHYNNAVIAGMLSLATFGADAIIDSGVAASYASANPLDVSSTDASLKMINEQYWATSGILFNFVDAWNNWKRTGYPVLTPVVFPKNFSGGVIPRRQPYPINESTLNTANYKAAVAKLSGGDTWSSKVWWDK